MRKSCLVRCHGMPPSLTAVAALGPRYHELWLEEIEKNDGLDQLNDLAPAHT